MTFAGELRLARACFALNIAWLGAKQARKRG
jgi:hypothetical protein